MSALLLLNAHHEYGIPVAAESLGADRVRLTFAPDGDDGPRVELVRNGATWEAPDPDAPDAPDPDAKVAALVGRATGRKGKPDTRGPAKLLKLADAAGVETISDQTGRAGAVIGGEVLDEDGLVGWLASASAAAGDIVGGGVLKDVARVILARPARPAHVFLRVGESQDGTRVFHDICDAERRAVEVDAHGWRILPTSAVLFRRVGAMKAQPLPATGGPADLEEFRALAGFSLSNFVMVVAWVVAALFASGPYPVLAICGRQGACKSTISKWIRLLVDPQAALVRKVAKDARALAIAARISHVLAFGNVSKVTPDQADDWCELATGCGFTYKANYTDDREIVFEATRPILSNGIPDLGERADLNDRTLAVTLTKPVQYRLQEEVDAEFEVMRPRVLGAMLSAVAGSLAWRDRVPVPGEFRMCDFAHRIVAAEAAGCFPWPPGTFLETYARNRDEVALAMVDSDTLAQDLIMALRRTPAGVLCGSASEILAMLKPADLAALHERKEWVGSAREIAGHLRRIAPALEAAGIDASFQDHGRRWTVRRFAPEPEGDE